MNSMQKRGLRKSITQGTVKSITDVRTKLAFKKRGIKITSVLIEKRIYESDLSWQERLRWAERIMNFDGKRKENIAWLTVAYNSEELAKEHIRIKSERWLGDNNPGYNHGGKMSKWSNKWKNYSSKEEAELGIREMAAAHSKKMKEGSSHRTTLYWLNRGYSEEDAIGKVSKIQVTFSKNKLVEKCGEEQGIKRWNERQEKWLKNYTKTNFSKISQLLFEEIMKELDDSYDIYFATHNRAEMEKYKNKEYTLKLHDRTVKPDFIDLNRKRIIEFDGDYWHNNNVANPTREKDRDISIIEGGYEILHVKECEFKKNTQRVIEECLKFLKS